MSLSLLWDLLKYLQSLWLNLINHSEVKVTYISGLLSGVILKLPSSQIVGYNFTSSPFPALWMKPQVSEEF